MKFTPKRDGLGVQRCAFAMPLACTGAMAVGLVLDTATVHPEALAAVCASATSLGASWALHQRAMPATTGLMLVASAAMLLSMARHGRGLLAELIGQSVMWWGMLGLLPLSAAWASRAGVSGFAAMLVAMALGVLGGWACSGLVRWCAPSQASAIIALLKPKEARLR